MFVCNEEKPQAVERGVSLMVCLIQYYFLWFFCCVKIVEIRPSPARRWHWRAVCQRVSDFQSLAPAIRHKREKVFLESVDVNHLLSDGFLTLALCEDETVVGRVVSYTQLYLLFDSDCAEHERIVGASGRDNHECPTICGCTTENDALDGQDAVRVSGIGIPAKRDMGLDIICLIQGRVCTSIKESPADSDPGSSNIIARAPALCKGSRLNEGLHGRNTGTVLHDESGRAGCSA